MKKTAYDKEHRIFWVVTLVIFCLILLLNCLTPLAADDFSYSFVHDTVERVGSVSDIFISQWNHYFNWGGRNVAHAIAQFFLWIGKPVFNLFNSIVFIIYINLLSFLAFGKRSVTGILSSFLLVWLLLPAPGTVLFWLVGACNYLWGPTFVFLFICRYYRGVLKNEETSPKTSVCLALLWSLFGVIAGWCNENTSGMGIFVCCLLTLYMYKSTKRIFLWEITGILGAVLGFSLMIAAPGNYIRASGSNDGQTGLFGLIKTIYGRFITADMRGFSAEGIDGALFFLFLFTYLLILILPRVEKERKVIGGIWFLGALACNYAMSLSPIYPDRAACGVYSMYFVSILYASRTLIEHFNTKILIDIVKVLLCMGCLYFSVSYFVAAGDLGYTYLSNRQRAATVLDEKSKGNFDVLVPALNPKTKYNPFTFISDWPAYDVALYYGVNSINIE